MFEKTQAFYDAIYHWKDYEGEAERLHALIQAANPGAQTLLDVACGTGKHIELLRDRYTATGTDLDPAMLDIARQRNPQATFHTADMLDFDLGQTFDAVTCLFSAIGHAETEANLRRGIATMARHVAPGGVLVVEPWLSPDDFKLGHIGSTHYDSPELKITRMNISEVVDGVSVLHMHYLIATPQKIDYLTETLRLGLFREEAYRAAFEAAGLTTRYDADGLMGRGLWLGVRPE